MVESRLPHRSTGLEWLLWRLQGMFALSEWSWEEIFYYSQLSIWFFKYSSKNLFMSWNIKNGLTVQAKQQKLAWTHNLEIDLCEVLIERDERQRVPLVQRNAEFVLSYVRSLRQFSTFSTYDFYSSKSRIKLLSTSPFLFIFLFCLSKSPLTTTISPLFSHAFFFFIKPCALKFQLFLPIFLFFSYFTCFQTYFTCFQCHVPVHHF